MACLAMVSCGKVEEPPQVQEPAAKPVERIDASAVYKDVESGEWYDEAVDWAVNDNISVAAKPDYFGTDDSVSKLDIILYLWKACGAPGAVATAKVNAESDIDIAIDWAINEGIVKAPSECAANVTASRLDAIEFIWNEAESPVIDDVPEFDDAKGVDSVNWARYRMITFGTGNNKFSPDMDCSKAHILTFLFRAK